jgi:hypothetical protein
MGVRETLQGHSRTDSHTSAQLSNCCTRICGERECDT